MASFSPAVRHAWADLLEIWTYTTVYNRSTLRKKGVWDRLMDAIMLPCGAWREGADDGQHKCARSPAGPPKNRVEIFVFGRSGED